MWEFTETLLKEWGFELYGGNYYTGYFHSVYYWINPVDKAINCGMQEQLPILNVRTIDQLKQLSRLVGAPKVRLS